MPLERRVQPARTNQRKCRKTREQPYRLSARLSGLRREGVTFECSTNRNAPARVPFVRLAKRSGHGTCVCTTYNEPMRTDDVRLDNMQEDEAEETQRLPTEQRPQTNANQNSRQTLSSTLRSDIMNRPGNNDSNPESIPSNLSTSDSDASEISEFSSMIPNLVPITSPSELSQSLASVTHFSRPPADAVQSTLTHGVPTCERHESLIAKELDQLTNHDRSVDEWSSSSILDFNSRCLSASFRTYRRSMSAMVQPPAYALQVASKVIRHARANKTPDEGSLWCPDCKRLPVQPVTGQCGHTRCTKCIQKNCLCPCGVQAPKILHVNTLIQGLIRKMGPTEPCQRGERVNVSNLREQPQRDRKLSQTSLPVRSCAAWRNGRRVSAGRTDNSSVRPISPKVPPRTLMSPQARFVLAQRMVAVGNHRDAAPHFARVAASPNPFVRAARALLAQSIAVLSKGVNSGRVARALYRAVRAQGANAWLGARDMECVLCYHSYTSPVSTPCGHTYCRTCIERSMDYRKSCALCLRSLEDFDLAATRDTVFVCAALESIGALCPPPPADPDVIPIFVCTVAYPAIPCPLFIFDPRYWLMIRRVLESGSRKFGMVAYERDRTYSDYGTVLEVCDCVHLEDGRSILSTVGVSRFRVIDRDVRDGCDVARIQPLTDITPTEDLVIWELQIMATQISYKAILWLNSMSRTVRSEIETAFGQLPHFDHAERREDWWDSPDGPAWLWWLVAILPLRSEIKILILSTKNLLKRMMAVLRTLDAIDQVAISATVTTECELRSALTNAAEWLERGA